MNKIGIIGAMDEEINQLIEVLDHDTVTVKAQMEFHEGQLEGKPVVLVRSGIGKVNAGICAQILADVFDVSCIINTGIAGGMREEIHIGDIVISEDVLHHDVDAQGFGYERGQIPRMDTLSFPANRRLIELARQICTQVNPEIQVFVGRVLTGDQFIAEQARKKEIQEWFHGDCTEMEGAAIAQAAYLNQLPFVIIRAISDNANEEATVDYPTFEKQAILHSVRLIKGLVQAI
ncbi:MAG: 5'-methylthioadenosine/adenosylhomocysteine nucleosidase [Lachnospiraceae bacterium]